MNFLLTIALPLLPESSSKPFAATVCSGPEVFARRRWLLSSSWRSVFMG
jgi:hypothetical protein